jgi:tetratricopeptide (TPR) repeat protein
MRPVLIAAAIASLAACAGGPQLPPDMAKDEKPAPLFTGLGNYHHAITTKSPMAQRYFDQGLTLAFAFNHAEAERSFRFATRYDPDCAMCWWGVAFVLGPNINAKMDPAANAPAWAAVQKAEAAAANVSPEEQDYVAAIALRYAADPPADRAPLDRAFADAMRELVRNNPVDLDAASAFAESLMNLNPWDYYDHAGRPKRSETGEIVGMLESVLARRPDHPWAIHLYIHATEASDHPERAMAYAEKLPALAPSAGHLVHMPAHTFMRIGRYVDAVKANEAAVAADDSYLEQCHAQGVYAVGYVPHNHHFMWAAASMAGMMAKALNASATTDEHTVHEMMREPGLSGLQHFAIQPMYAMVRFGRWEDILSLPPPPADLLYPTGFWHYARGRAYAAQNDFGGAESELKALSKIAGDPALAGISTFDINPASKLLAIAVQVLTGELAAAQQKYKPAIKALENAVALEDSLNYNEPPDWNYPARHSLGAVLLAAGKPDKAEEVYQDDLSRNPENGWSLYGLAQALDAQKRKAEADDVRTRFARAWANADIQITASRI